MNKTNIEFVSYTGAYPNLCSGILTMKVNGKEYEFGHDWLNSLPPQMKEICCCVQLMISRIAAM